MRFLYLRLFMPALKVQIIDNENARRSTWGPQPHVTVVVLQRRIHESEGIICDISINRILFSPHRKENVESRLQLIKQYQI